MALDPYAPCPCGSGKKLKFCECHADAVDVEKAITAIDGDQRVAALDIINRVLAQKPHQKAMLSLKGMVCLQLGDWDQARQAIATFNTVAPTNIMALTLSALIDLQDNKVHDAITKVHKAIGLSPQELHYSIPDALFNIARSLVLSGRYIAARAHLMLRLSLTQGEQPENEEDMGLTLLRRLNATDEISIVQKQMFFPPSTTSASAPFADGYAKAMETATLGNWLGAAQQFDELDKKHPQQPDVLRALAVFRTYLDLPSASATWSRYAAIPNLPADDALEAEVLALELDTQEDDTVDRIRITYAVKDAAKLLEILASDSRVVRMGADLRTLVPEGSPPPRGAYWLLDRESVSTEEGLTRDMIPSIMGDLLLFGKETDREARLEYVVTKTADLVSKVRRLQSVGGELLGMIEKEEKIDAVSTAMEAMTIRWRLPKEVSKETRDRLLAEQFTYNVLEVFPKLPQKRLGGKSPREVAADPAYRIKLLASIRSLEIDYQHDQRNVDFNELRRQLGLPPLEELDPTGVDFAEVSPQRYGRYDVAKLGNDALEDLIDFASRIQHRYAMWKVARQAIDRAELPEAFQLCDAYEILARTDRDPDQALKFNLEAQAAAIKIGRSPARYLLVEFDLRLMRGEVQEVQRILTTLQSKHSREPGVSEAVYMKLMRLGLINPDGTPRMPGGGMPPAPGMERETAPAAAGSGLWTPDGSGSAATSEQSSKLWLPGMD